ncbi:MAG: peroxiredoxin [Alphaproteobacteria bacterium]|nr:peroxiredoxin [Alphaproteobacteria bacterium]
MTTPLKPGQPAPDFTAAATDGELTLSALRGQPVVLYFYPKDNTPGCTTEACDFRDLSAAFAEAGARIYGVSQDSIRKHENFIEKHSLSFPLISDPDHTVHHAYDTWVEKKNYGRTYMGTERSTFLIDARGNLARIWRNVRVKGHVDEVLAAVKGLAGA